MSLVMHNFTLCNYGALLEMSIKNVLLSGLLGLALTTNVSTASCINEDADRCNAQVQPSPVSNTLTEILSGLYSKAALKQKIELHNPKRILADVNRDLSNYKNISADESKERIDSLVRKAIFAFWFHNYFTQEILPDKVEHFLDNLIKLSPGNNVCKKVTGKKKAKGSNNIFQNIPDLNDAQKTTLQQLHRKEHYSFFKSSLSIFFSDKVPEQKTQKKMIIDLILPAFRKQIVEECSLSHTTSNSFLFSDGILLNINEHLLEYAVLFGSVTAVNILTGKVLQAEKDGRTDGLKKWYQLLSDRGCVTSMNTLGCIFAEEGNLVAAKEYFLKSANLNNSEAMFNLAIFFNNADDAQKYKEWLEKAAKLNHVNSMYHLGGVLFEEKKNQEAKEWFEKAAELGHAGSMFDLGNILLQEKKNQEAKEWLQRAMILNHPAAPLYLALVCGIEGNSTGAKQWMEKAKDHDTVLWNYTSGLIKEKVEGNIVEAKKSFQKAADLDHSASMHNLGVLLEKEGDNANAERWYRKASEKGYINSVLHLARLLEKLGKISEAESSFKQAISLGVENAERYYTDFCGKLGIVTAVTEYFDFDESSADREETPPSLSKRHEKFYARDEKQRKAEVLTISDLFDEEKALRSYKDVTVFCHPDAESEVLGGGEFKKIKIQGLISCLANGENNRARFEALKGHDSVCSARLTKGDRLVFKILEGSTTNGVESILVLSATGHYKTLENRARSKTQSKEITWE